MGDLEDRNNLKDSPLYNLSLSSLENFHSAFLAWIGNNYKEGFLEVFKDCFQAPKEWEKFGYIFCGNDKVPPEDIECICQSREGKKNIIDIKISIFKGGKGPGKEEANIYIENKFKSYPTQDQIDRYQDQIDKYNEEVKKEEAKTEKQENKKVKNEKVENRIVNDKIILLTLAPTEEINGCFKMNYIELCNKLKLIFSNKDFKTYNGYLIKDYIDMIDIISRIFNEELKVTREKEDKSKLKLNFQDVKNDILKENEGLKDAYIKYRGGELAEYLRKGIYKNDTKNKNIISKFNNKNSTIDINILYYDMKNLNVIKENKKKCDDEYCKIGIQIEGKQYRHYMIFPSTFTSATKQEEFAQEMKDENRWFIDMEFTKFKKKVFENFTGYNKNGLPNFIYLYKKLDVSSGENGETYGSLLNKIEIDKAKLEQNQNQDAIKAILEKYIK